jgi:hypothetical protein
MTYGALKKRLSETKKSPKRKSSYSVKMTPETKPKLGRLMPVKKTTSFTLLTRELLMKLRIMKSIAPVRDPKKEIDFTKTIKKNSVNSAECMVFAI